MPRRFLTKYSADSEGLPSAPVAQTGTAPTNVLDTSAAAPSQSPSGSSSPAAPQYPAQTVPSSVGTSTARTLTIKDAEQIALKNNPQISVARLTAMASQQVVRETRSAFWPAAGADLTAVDSNDRRIAAGGLNNPIIFERDAMGATVGQLITDFGPHRKSRLQRESQCEGGK